MKNSDSHAVITVRVHIDKPRCDDSIFCGNNFKSALFGNALRDLGNFAGLNGYIQQSMQVLSRIDNRAAFDQQIECLVRILLWRCIRAARGPSNPWSQKCGASRNKIFRKFSTVQHVRVLFYSLSLPLLSQSLQGSPMPTHSSQVRLRQCNPNFYHDTTPHADWGFADKRTNYLLGIILVDVSGSFEVGHSMPVGL